MTESHSAAAVCIIRFCCFHCAYGYVVLYSSNTYVG